MCNALSGLGPGWREYLPSGYLSFGISYMGKDHCEEEYYSGHRDITEDLELPRPTDPTSKPHVFPFLAVPKRESHSPFIQRAGSGILRARFPCQGFGGKSAFRRKSRNVDTFTTGGGSATIAERQFLARFGEKR